MIRRWPLIPFTRLLAYSLLPVAPTLIALDVLVYLHDLDARLAIGVMSGTTVSSVLIAWIFLGDLADMALYVRQVATGEHDALPQLRSRTAVSVAEDVAQLNRRWRKRVDVFSQSIATDMEILESLHDPLIFVNADRMVIRANEAARRLFGRDLANEPVQSAFTVASLHDGVQRSLDTGEIVTLDVEWPGVEPRHFEVRVVPVNRIAAGETYIGEADIDVPIIAAVVTLHETTELWRAAELRERFIANISHELRTPLSSIIGCVETIQGAARSDPAAQERFLSIIAQQSRRMARLVADLLRLSEIEQAETDELSGTVNVGSVIRDVVAALDVAAQERKMSIELNVPEGFPPVRGDTDQIFQVFLNVIENAIKYGAEATTIDIDTSFGSGLIVTKVSDRGEGIAPEHLAHLGERFYRVDSARASRTGGSGLGLAIACKILKRHGGSMHIESIVGTGSVFTIELPVKREP
jgi:two-component system phosphate regulon sensor histidine kinase PhoR